VKRGRTTDTTPAGGRREKALATRRRVLAAAYDLFCANGYASTTMHAIAAAAGVAVQTLYFTFHTKGAILTETVGACIVGIERWTPALDPVQAGSSRKALLESHAWFDAFIAAPDARMALAVFIDASIEIMRKVAPLVGVVAAAEASAPEVQAIGAVAERRRVEAYGFVVAELAKKGGLRKGLSLRHARDILLTLLSADTFQRLAGDRGWSVAECRRWLHDVVGQQLLAEAAPGRTRAPKRAHTR